MTSNENTMVQEGDLIALLSITHSVETGFPQRTFHFATGDSGKTRVSHVEARYSNSEIRKRV